MGGKRIVADAPGLLGPVDAHSRGLSFSEWWQIVVAARQDARLLTPECSLNRLLGPGIRPAKARVLRDYYRRVYGATAAALYGVVMPQWTCESPHTSLYEDDGERPEQVFGA